MKDTFGYGYFCNDFSTYYDGDIYQGDLFTRSIWEAVGLENERCEDRDLENCDPVKRDKVLEILELSWPMGWKAFSEGEYVSSNGEMTFVISEGLFKLFFLGRTNALVCMEEGLLCQPLSQAILNLRKRYEGYNEGK
jgi:hypothetical protein